MEEMYKKWSQENEGTKEDFFKSVIDPLNKEIRKYKGDNSFMLSIQKGLKNSRNSYEMNGRKYKILSDKQYEAVKSILS
jgi:hypothetical protein